MPPSMESYLCCCELLGLRHSLGCWVGSLLDYELYKLYPPFPCPAASALCSTSSRAKSALLRLDARCSGVHPRLSSAAMSAPCSTRSRASPISPRSHARCKGVHPLPSWDVVLAPCLMRSRASSTLPGLSSTLPRLHTRCNG